MKTVNSLSGGKTSAYIAANYPADYNVFALVRTNDKKCLFPDAKIRQIVSDKIGHDFIGTLEEDTIIYTILDLEQFIGKEIVWLSDTTFEDVINKAGGYLPNIMTRFCTSKMKVEPIAQWCYENIELPYRKVEFPLIKDAIFKDKIEKYWEDKPVRFAYRNNCVGCFHRNELMLKYMSEKASKQFDWFIEQEQKNNCTFKSGITYEKIKNHRLQLDLFDEDFQDCDSGYCGL